MEGGEREIERAREQNRPRETRQGQRLRVTRPDLTRPLRVEPANRSLRRETSGPGNAVWRRGGLPVPRLRFYSAVGNVVGSPYKLF